MIDYAFPLMNIIYDFFLAKQSVCNRRKSSSTRLLSYHLSYIEMVDCMEIDEIELRFSQIHSEFGLYMAMEWNDSGELIFLFLTKLKTVTRK